MMFIIFLIVTLKDFLEKNVVAIGWPSMGELSNINSKDDVWRKLDQAGYNNNRSNRAIGQDVGVIYRFVKEMKKDDYILVPN